MSQKNNHRNRKNGRNHEKLDIESVSELGVLARGQIPWVKRELHKRYSKISEVEYAYMLSRAESYRFEDGAMKGRPDYGRIAEEINKEYHRGQMIRDRYTVRNALYRFKCK
jgi:hypothetical protein